jgi:tetratricopeptide (TPR) repeat protein
MSDTENNERIQKFLGFSESAYERQDYALTEIYLREALKLDQNNAEAMNGLGVAQHLQGKYAEAESSFRESLAREPSNLAFLTNLGQNLMRQERWKEAEDCFIRAIGVDETLARPHYHLGKAHAAQGNTAKALEQLRIFREKDTDHDPETVQLVEALEAQLTGGGTPAPEPGAPQ